MPGTIKREKPSPSVRKGAHTGKNKQTSRRQDSFREKASAPAIIAGSLFALTLHSKRGFEIENDEFSPFEYSISTIAKDLLAAVTNAIKLLYNEQLDLPFDKKATTGEVMKFVLDTFETRILSKVKDAAYNIDSTGSDSYYFTIYKILDFASYWHYFPIKPVVNSLQGNKPLLNLFYQSLAVLHSVCGFNTWYYSFYAYEMYIEDEVGFYDFIENEIEGSDEEEALEIRLSWDECRKTYLHGDAYTAMQQIKKANPDYKQLKRKLSAYKGSEPIVNWMKMVVDMAATHLNLEDMRYETGDYEDEKQYAFWNEDDGAIRLTDQVVIVWSDDNDNVFDMASMYIDNDAANFGTEMPVLAIPVSRHSKPIHLSNIEAKEQFPQKISALFNRYAEVIKPL